MFLAGASGCLVKETGIGGLAAAVGAVVSGYTVLSPQLHSLYGHDTHHATNAPVGRAGRSADRQLGSLTSRERTVLDLLAQGMSTAEVAARLKVSPATVKSHVSHTFSKLGVRNRLEAVLVAQRAMFSAGEPVPVAVPVPVAREEHHPPERHPHEHHVRRLNAQQLTASGSTTLRPVR
jgi:DNA-binding NarL/FixJ family response regulator